MAKRVGGAGLWKEEIKGSHVCVCVCVSIQAYIRLARCIALYCGTCADVADGVREVRELARM